MSKLNQHVKSQGPATLDHQRFYANAFVPFMTKEFNEITMVDLRYYTGDVNSLVKEYLITDILVLYNINTFNDDNSILNIADPLDHVPNLEESTELEAKKIVQLTTRLTAVDGGNLYVTLKNKSAVEIKYRRQFSLEIRTESGWDKVNETSAYQWDETERSLGTNANVEYLINLTQVYGPLKSGSYRITQSYDNDATVNQEFKIKDSF